MIFKISTETHFRKLYMISSCLVLFSALFASQALALTCKDVSKQLRGEYEMTQSQGGIWGYMEQAGSLKKDSMIGFQVDSKMQRLVVYFEAGCENGKPVPQEVLNKIHAELSKARQIVNKTPGRTPAKQIMEMITGLNQSLDKTMGELGL